MSSRIVIMREAITRIVKMLAEKHVKVTQRGASAFVKYDATGRPIRVNIPYIPDDASDELIDAIQGFVDHEVGHILFSDYKAIKDANEQGVGRLHNIIEDAFVERKMAEKFAGCGYNLANTGRFFLAQYIEPELKAHPEAAEGILINPAIRAWSGQAIYADFMAGRWESMKRVQAALGETVNLLPLCDSSWDCLDLALKFRDALKKPPREEPTEPPPPPPPPSEDEAETRPAPDFDPEDSPSSGGTEDDDDDMPPPEDDADADTGGTGEGSTESEAEADGEPSDDLGTETSASGDSSESGPEDGEKGEGSGSGTLDTGEDDAPEDSKPSGSEGASLDDDREGGSKVEDDGPTLFDEISEKMGDGFEEAVAKALTEKSLDDSKEADYMVYTTELDIIEPLNVGHRMDDSYLKSMTDRVDHMVGPLQKDLERIIAARSASTWSTGHRSGRLHSSALAKLTAFKDDRVFRRKHVNDSKDVAVELLIDCSGSMGGSKITTAAYAAYGMSSVLDRMMIPHEVIGFTTNGDLPAEMRSEEAKLGIRYARREILYMPIIKGFTERMGSEVKKRFSVLPASGILSENVDGECLQIAASRLATRRETRKILMVFSDGHPACPGDRGQLYRHLKKVAGEVEASGIDLLAIGIESDAPKMFYKKHITLNNVSDLPTTVMGEIKRLLTQN